MSRWSVVVCLLVAACSKSEKAPPSKIIDARPADAAAVSDAVMASSTDAAAAPTPPTASAAKILEVVIADRVACARRSDGRVRCWGTWRDDRGLPAIASAVELSEIKTAVAIDLDPNHTILVVTDDGSVKTGRLDLRGTTHFADLDGVTDVVDVRGHHSTPVALTRTGNVVAPASADPILTNAVALRRAANGAIQVLHRDGRVSWFDGKVHQVPELADATSLFGDRCAERRTGTRVCWDSGRIKPWVGATNIIDRIERKRLLCDLTTSGVACAGKVLDMPGKPIAIAAGVSSACAVLDTGEVACWGQNDGGQLGDGTLRDRRSPTLVTGLTTPSPPPPSDGRAQVQEAATAMDWSDLPAACKRPGALASLTKVASGYAYPDPPGTMVWLADFALEPDGIADPLAPVRGSQRAIQLTLSNGRRPVDRGRYANRGPRIAQLATYLAEEVPVSAKQVDLVVELVDKNWICGQLLAVDGAQRRQPFAARVHKRPR